METKKEEKNQCMIQQHNIQGSLFGRDIKMYSSIMFCWDSLLVRAPDSWSKGVSSNPVRSGGIIFFSRVNSVCGLLFRICSNPVTAVAHKRPRSFCQKCRWQVTPKLAYTFDPTSVGTYQETSSHATRHGTLGHSRLSLLSHCGLILA